MRLTDALIGLAENGRIPDAAIRAGIRQLLRQRLRDERRRADRGAALLAELRSGPIAPRPECANAQHYEVPAAFFASVLGPRCKYSACLWEPGVASLADAEEAMLRAVAARAGLEDGMRILDLGCGWGAFALWAAQRYPASRILALSNSAAQRAFIESRRDRLGLAHLQVETADIGDWKPAQRFDRIVSIEMFEHLRNYHALLARIAEWLTARGRLFVHVFCHRRHLYRFEAAGSGDWMAREFFSEGLMPAADTLPRFQSHLRLIGQWRICGIHYRDTARAWLANLDANRDAAAAALAGTSGKNGGDGRKDGKERDAQRALQRWRMFFMACEETFGFAGGSEWHIGHYAFAPKYPPNESGPGVVRGEKRNRGLASLSQEMDCAMHSRRT